MHSFFSNEKKCRRFKPTTFYRKKKKKQPSKLAAEKENRPGRFRAWQERGASEKRTADFRLEKGNSSSKAKERDGTSPCLECPRPGGGGEKGGGGGKKGKKRSLFEKGECEKGRPLPFSLPEKKSPLHMEKGRVGGVNLKSTYDGEKEKKENF